MYKIISILFTIFFFINVYGQKTEIQVQLNSGLFSFSGKSTEKSSFINYSEEDSYGYTNNPYGKKSAISFGGSGNIKRITKNNFLFGADLGFEILRSKIEINEIYASNGIANSRYNAKGNTYLINNFLNLYNYFGYRFFAKKLSFDVTTGLDIGYRVSAKENGKATALDGINYNTSTDRKTIKTDFRPRFQIETKYKNIGLYCGYSVGISNYKSNHQGGINEVYSRYLRFGSTYKFK